MIRFGADILAATPTLLGAAQRVGLVTNNAARLASDVSQHSRVALKRAGVPLVRLFGPEHGLSGAGADGEAMRDDVDFLTGLPTFSLYGDRMRPTREMLQGLDAILFDIPDIGARFYTFIWTLHHVLSAAEEFGVPVVVLDRPNPLGGLPERVEGPLLDLAHRSFIGNDVIPIRHSLTVGELARLWQSERFPRLSLRVIPVHGWTRDARWPSLALPWVPTSPSMPSYESAAIYPGTCLFEATNVSVARGTDAPFQQFGAPWMNAARVCELLAPNTAFGAEPCEFTPELPPYRGERCRGVRLRFADTGAIGPVAVGLLALAAVKRAHPREFRWSTYPTAANPTGNGHFERLFGQPGVREFIEASPERVTLEQVQAWTAAGDWRARVERSNSRIY